MDENTQERTIDELMDLPYSEMTDEEIERVVEFKAANIARDAEHVARMDALHEALEVEIGLHRDMADTAQTKLEELTAHAISRFENESA